MSDVGSRLPLLHLESITDPELRAVVARAESLSTPKPAWYLTLGHHPEMATAYAAFWDLTHRGGQVEHLLKELMRITISQLLGCEFCAQQRSVLAQQQGLTEEVVACALPEFDHPNLRIRAALRFARALTLDAPQRPSDFDAVYAELLQVFTPAEIVELGCFAAIAIGGVKLARSLRIEP